MLAAEAVGRRLSSKNQNRVAEECSRAGTCMQGNFLWCTHFVDDTLVFWDFWDTVVRPALAQEMGGLRVIIIDYYNLITDSKARPVANVSET